MSRKVKIVATLGPATDNTGKITQLIKAGVNVFRLNFSYGTHESHYETFKRIRSCAEKLNKDVAVMQDICGPKIRIKGMTGTREVKKGDTLIMAHKSTATCLALLILNLSDNLTAVMKCSLPMVR